jgi:hypothetical protein
LRNQGAGGFKLGCTEGVSAVPRQCGDGDVVALECLDQAAGDHLELEGAIILSRASFQHMAIVGGFEQATAHEKINGCLHLRSEAPAVPGQKQLTLDEGIDDPPQPHH